MTPSEVQDLLMEASIFDGRPVTDEAVLSWHRYLRNTDPAQAMQAMRTHFETEERRLMPSHVIQGVRKLRADLMSNYQGPGLSKEIPTSDPNDVMGYLRDVRALRATAGDGAPVDVLALEGRIGRMPNYMKDRETTPRAVPCTENDCRARPGHDCRSRRGETRAPHEVRVADFRVWQEKKERHIA